MPHCTVPQPNHRAAFTRIDLLVLVVVTAVTGVAVLAAADRAGDMENKIRDAKHMRDLGTTFYLFALDHDNRFPSMQVHACPNIQGAWWLSWMYSRDYYMLRTRYGASPEIFVSTTTGDGFEVSYAGDGGHASMEEYMTVPANAARLEKLPASITHQWLTAQPLPEGKGPESSPYALEYVQHDFTQFTRNWGAATAAPWEAGKTTNRTTMKRPEDLNPPIWANLTYRQPGLAVFAHGTQWELDENGNSIGDASMNILYRDGSVQNKPPGMRFIDNNADWYYGGVD